MYKIFCFCFLFLFFSVPSLAIDPECWFRSITRRLGVPRTVVFNVPISPDQEDLDLSSRSINVQGSELLATLLPRLHLLTSLNLSATKINGTCIGLLTEAIYWSSLKILKLAGNPLGDHGIRALKLPRHLTALDLSNTDFGPAGAGKLAIRLRKRPTLSILRIAGNPLGDLGVESLFLPPALTQLDLSKTGFGPAGARSLAIKFGELPSLSVLRIAGNPLGPEGITALFQTPLPALQVLDVSHISVSIKSLQFFNGSLQKMGNLRDLTLKGMRLGDEGIRTFQDMPRSLETLSLEDNNIGAEGMAFLQEAPFLRRLRSLNLSDNEITAGQVSALLDHAPYLLVLAIEGTPYITDSDVKQLRRRHPRQDIRYDDPIETLDFEP